MSKAVTFTKNAKLESFSTNVIDRIASSGTFSPLEIGRATAEGVLLSAYTFKKYLTPDPEVIEKELNEVSVTWQKDRLAFSEGLEQGKVIASATNLAKDLVNEPAINMTTDHLHRCAEEITKDKRITLKVLEKKDLEEIGCGAILGVSKGSYHPPKLLILEYNGTEDGPVTAFVGKGITFDTGGYNLKLRGGMENMKSDMSGAATVLAVVNAAAELGVRRKIVGVAPVCENVISGNAIKPGDVLVAYNKKTIEVIDTDAEGRLILADALSYAEEKYRPEIIIDIATLTGACITALGYQVSGVIGTNKELIDALVNAGEESYDRVWPLPLLEEYKESMKGTITDLKNLSVSGYGAGAITAAVFLSHFVQNAKWAHIDIAGPSFLTEERDYLQKGATGSGVRLLMYYLLSQC